MSVIVRAEAVRAGEKERRTGRESEEKKKRRKRKRTAPLRIRWYKSAQQSRKWSPDIAQRAEGTEVFVFVDGGRSIALSRCANTHNDTRNS